MGEILRAPDRERIRALLQQGRFFWLDMTLADDTMAELREALAVPGDVDRALTSFGDSVSRMKKFHFDADHVVFTFSCFVDAAPVEVHVLVSGEYLLTLHREPLSLPDVLDVDLPAGRTEQYLIYAVLEGMLATSFDSLVDLEDEIVELQRSSTDLQGARIRIDTLRTVSSRLTLLRRRVAPQRGTFARIADEIGRVRGLEPDSERYFDRIGDQINRLVEAIDAAADAVAKLIDLRVNETIYWLTVVATVFLPLTFVTGFFGMNFGWMVKNISSPLAFFALGVGGCVVGVVLTLLGVRRRGTPVEPERHGHLP